MPLKNYLGVLLFVIILGALRPARAEVSDSEVNAAIQAGIRFLLKNRLN